MSVSEPPEKALQLNKDLAVSCLKETALKTDVPVGVNACSNNNLSPHLEDRLKLPDDTNNSVIISDESSPGIANGSVEKSVCCQHEHANGFALSNSENENQDQSQGPRTNTPVTKCDSEKRVIENATCHVSDCGSNVSQISPLSESDVFIESEDAEQSGKSVVSNSENCNSVEVEKLVNDLENTSIQDKLTLEESDNEDGITYVVYESEKQMPDIMRLITKDLSEPYSIYTYRYFIHNWPKLCFLAMDRDTCIGAIVCKLDLHKKMVRRGYIAMLAVDSAYRRRKLGSTLVTKAIKAMIRDDCDEVVLETEITNQAALRLYENLGFVRDKRLFRYYLNGVDALRLKLWLR